MEGAKGRGIFRVFFSKPVSFISEKTRAFALMGNPIWFIDSFITTFLPHFQLHFYPVLFALSCKLRAAVFWRKREK